MTVLLYGSSQTHLGTLMPSGGGHIINAYPKAAITRVRTAFEPDAISIDEMDGLGFDMGDWRFNLRNSNTEPVVRLNVEARVDVGLVSEVVKRITHVLLAE